MDDAELAGAIEKGRAPRVTRESIEARIRDERYLSPPYSTVTICVLTIDNGFCVIGQSACVSPENYREDVGKEIARNHAINQLWQLEGYLLAERLQEDERQMLLPFN